MDDNKLRQILEALDQKDEVSTHLISNMEKELTTLEKLGVPRSEVAVKLGLMQAAKSKKARASSSTKKAKTTAAAAAS